MEKTRNRNKTDVPYIERLIRRLWTHLDRISASLDPSLKQKKPEDKVQPSQVTVVFSHTEMSSVTVVFNNAQDKDLVVAKPSPLIGPM